jgi:hypothetical protein
MSVCCLNAQDSRTPVYVNCNSRYITAITFRVNGNAINGVYYQRTPQQNQFESYFFTGMVHVDENNNLVFEAYFPERVPPGLVGTSANEVTWTVKYGTRLYVPLMKNTPDISPLTTIDHLIEFQRVTL